MLPTAFLTGIKTRKGKGKKRGGKKRIFSLCSFDPALFSLYENGRPLHPAGYAPQPAPLSVGEGFIFFLDKNEHSVLYSFFFFLYLLKRKEKEKEREKRRKREKRRIKRLFGAKTLRADFPTQNLYLFLYAFSFLKINVKQFFRVIFFTLGLL